MECPQNNSLIKLFLPCQEKNNCLAAKSTNEGLSHIIDFTLARLGIKPVEVVDVSKVCVIYKEFLELPFPRFRKRKNQVNKTFVKRMHRQLLAVVWVSN